MNIISQVSNLAMDGFVGFMMNYSNTIPLAKQVSYMKKKKDPLFNDYFDEWFESERIKSTQLKEEEARTIK